MAKWKPLVFNSFSVFFVQLLLHFGHQAGLKISNDVHRQRLARSHQDAVGTSMAGLGFRTLYSEDAGKDSMDGLVWALQGAFIMRPAVKN